MTTDVQSPAPASITRAPAEFLALNPDDPAPDFFNLAHVAAVIFMPGADGDEFPPAVHLAFAVPLALPEGGEPVRDLLLELSPERWHQLRAALAARSI